MGIGICGIYDSADAADLTWIRLENSLGNGIVYRGTLHSGAQNPRGGYSSMSVGLPGAAPAFPFFGVVPQSGGWAAGREEVVLNVEAVSEPVARKASALMINAGGRSVRILKNGFSQ